LYFKPLAKPGAFVSHHDKTSDVHWGAQRTHLCDWKSDLQHQQNGSQGEDGTEALARPIEASQHQPEN
jgi:hypothetical protein